MVKDETKRKNILETILFFLKLGIIGFGGPAADIALMREELVRKRRWVTDKEFLDLVGAVNLIPGPNSTEMAIHLGFCQSRVDRSQRWSILFHPARFLNCAYTGMVLR